MAAAFFLVLFSASVPAFAKPFLVRGPQLLDTQIVKGHYWGKPAERVAGRLGLGFGPARMGLHDQWFVEKALAELWTLNTPKDFEYVRVASAAWFFVRDGRLLGYLARVPEHDWGKYDTAGRRRFGDPADIRFKVESAPDKKLRPRYIHILRWADRKTQFILLKPTLEDSSTTWMREDIGTLMEVRLHQRVAEPEIPLYIGAFDVKRLKKLGGGPVAGRGRRSPGRDVPKYLVPLTPQDSSGK